MLKMFLIDGNSLLFKGLNRFRNVNRIPQDNCCDHEIQCTGTMALIFVGAISYLT